MNSPSSSLDTARKHYANGNIVSALETLTHIIEGTNPPSRDALRMRAHIHLGTQDYAQAAADLDILLKYYPTDSESLDDRGVLFQMQNDYMNAAIMHLHAVENTPTNDGYILNLAIALDHLGQRQNAQQLYRDILLINPNNARAMTNLGIILDQNGQNAEALSYFEKALDLGHDQFELYFALANLYRKEEKTDQAITFYKKALAKKPTNKQAQFFLDVMQGQNPEAPPEEHISDLFDSYAETFEKSLIDRLKYRAPEFVFNHIKSDIEHINSTDKNARALDLGAGTGLFGKLIRPYFKTSIGLDLSEKMLLKAQENNIYDEIICVEMLRGLQEFSDNYFQLISATDVFVYQGNLDALFKEAHRTLVQGGIFAFSTEALHQNDDTENVDYLLGQTGRYTHSEAYIRRLAKAHNFDIATFEHNWLRYNKDKPLDGFIIVLKKAA